VVVVPFDTASGSAWPEKEPIVVTEPPERGYEIGVL